MGIFQFVDSIASSPSVRLDLNTGSLLVGDAIDLSPPPLRRAVVSTMLTDGELIPASAYSNRVIRLPLQLNAASPDAAATVLQNLGRELDRPNNILKVQLGTAPVFFRTFSAPDYTWAMIKLLSQNGVATLEIPAEPFAYGLREDINSGSTITVNNDPAAGSNGLFFDVTAVKGDVETPLFMKVDFVDTIPGVSGRQIGVFATRRRGTPSALPVPLVFQAEASSSLGNSTTLQSNDAAMSGAGSNYVRCTFSNPAMVHRVGLPVFPASPSVDVRGTYRIFARVRKSVAGDVIQMRFHLNSVNGDTVTLPGDATIRYVDLGLLQLPPGRDPITDGYSNEETVVQGMNTLSIEAGRVSGSGNLDIDVLVFVPADDRLAFVKWEGLTGPEYVVVDSARNIVYNLDSDDSIRQSREFAEIVGSLPRVSPAVTNRIVYMKDVGSSSANGDDKTGTFDFTAYYWPRYLHVRPVST